MFGTRSKFGKPNQLKRLLKPNTNYCRSKFQIDAKYYGKFWAAYDVPIHFWHFSKTAIK
jgi:hypothetical protein